MLRHDAVDTALREQRAKALGIAAQRSRHRRPRQAITQGLPGGGSSGSTFDRPRRHSACARPHPRSHGRAPPRPRRDRAGGVAPAWRGAHARTLQAGRLRGRGRADGQDRTAVAFVVGNAGARADDADAAVPLPRFSSGIVASFLFYALYGSILPAPVASAPGLTRSAPDCGCSPDRDPVRVRADWRHAVNRVGERALVVGGVFPAGSGSPDRRVAAPDLAYVRLVTAHPPAPAFHVTTRRPNAILGAVAASDVGKASGTFTLRWLCVRDRSPGAVFAGNGSADSRRRSALDCPAIGFRMPLLLAAIAGPWLPAGAA